MTHEGEGVMRWSGRRQSDNVEDRRGMRGPAMALGGGGLVIVLLIGLLMGADPAQLLQVAVEQQGARQEQAGARTARSPEEDELAQFVGVVLADTEDVWHDQFGRMGREYREPKLVLFTGRVQSACGFATAASGPFYCPEDEKVYIDLGFYQELRKRFGASGDFAQAYVIAHEIGHHVQKQLGTMDKVHGAQGRVSQEEYNQLSVRLELQADFLAGVWARQTQRMKQVLEPGDVEEAMRCASAIGDDRIQMQSQGYVVPDGFTHGTSEQRLRWFRKGFDTGDIAQGDTFSARQP
jgi:uncharacterized protein